MKTKLHQVTIDVPQEIATGIDGDATIIIRTRLKKKWLRKLNERTSAAMHVQALAQKLIEAGENDIGTLELAQESTKAFDDFEVSDKKLPEFLRYFVLGWNWIDEETGKPLPKPDNPEVFEELYEDQINWIMSQVNDLRRYRAAEGNESNTTE